MPGKAEKDKPNRVQNRRVHLANERTFLAWIRTADGSNRLKGRPVPPVRRLPGFGGASILC
jgi:hypothetical protein